MGIINRKDAKAAEDGEKMGNGKGNREFYRGGRGERGGRIEKIKTSDAHLFF